MRAAVLVLAVATLGCGPPPLTEARVIEDLGSDELWFTFHYVRDECAAQLRAGCRDDVFFAQAAEYEATHKAGWLTPLCKKDPTIATLTPLGKAGLARWRTSTEPNQPCTSLSPFTFLAGTFERTGRPVIRDGENKTEKLVTLPGHWKLNADGEVLAKAGHPKLVAPERVVEFSYWRGKWSHNHAVD